MKPAKWEGCKHTLSVNNKTLIDVSFGCLALPPGHILANQELPRGAAFRTKTSSSPVGFGPALGRTIVTSGSYPASFATVWPSQVESDCCDIVFCHVHLRWSAGAQREGNESAEDRPNSIRFTMKNDTILWARTLDEHPEDTWKTLIDTWFNRYPSLITENDE